MTLLDNIKRELSALKGLHKEAHDHWGEEDIMYRFYHHSFKVWRAQGLTLQITEALERIAPEGAQLCETYKKIVFDGTCEKFNTSMNRDRDTHARPLIEAFQHARYFLDMAVKYGGELEEEPQILPRCYAALLELYGLR